MWTSSGRMQPGDNPGQGCVAAYLSRDSHADELEQQAQSVILMSGVEMFSLLI